MGVECGSKPGKVLVKKLFKIFCHRHIVVMAATPEPMSDLEVPSEVKPDAQENIEDEGQPDYSLLSSIK